MLAFFTNPIKNLKNSKVAYSRTIAMKIYRRMLELRPEWQKKVAVVMTSSNKDPEDWRTIIGNDNNKKEEGAGEYSVLDVVFY